MIWKGMNKPILKSVGRRGARQVPICQTLFSRVEQRPGISLLSHVFTAILMMRIGGRASSPQASCTAIDCGFGASVGRAKPAIGCKIRIADGFSQGLRIEDKCDGLHPQLATLRFQHLPLIDGQNYCKATTSSFYTHSHPVRVGATC